MNAASAMGSPPFAVCPLVRSRKAMPPEAPREPAHGIPFNH